MSRAPQRFGDSRLGESVLAVWQARTDSIPVSRTSFNAVQSRYHQIMACTTYAPHDLTAGCFTRRYFERPVVASVGDADVGRRCPASRGSSPWASSAVRRRYGPQAFCLSCTLLVNDCGAESPHTANFWVTWTVPARVFGSHV